jgi:Ca-activated chloride channel homolog
MTFQNPWVLLLIPLVPIILFLAGRRRVEAGIRFSNTDLFAGLKESVKIKLFRKIVFLRALSLTLIILAIARPQAVTEETSIFRRGIDMVLSVDVSTSMLAEDFTPNAHGKARIEAAKEVIRDFVGMRKDDRIGMVVFASRPYPLCPLTLDHDWLRQNLDRVQVGMIEDGTAIGSGLISSLTHLKGTEPKERLVILLTDGRNNAGDLPPIAAAEAAKALKIKVYTIGIGSKGNALYPVSDPFGKTIRKPVAVDLDEETLKAIASKTGAAYFRATDADALRNIYREIDRLEKHTIEEKRYRQIEEWYALFLLPGILLLLLEFMVRHTLLRRLP